MYHVGRNGQQTGPYSIEQLRMMASRGELSPSDLVWQEGMPSWEPASSLPGVFSDSPALGGGGHVVPPVSHAAVLPPVGAQPPANYLVFSILVTLCCCLPLGVPAIVFSSQVNSKMAAGDYAGAQDSAAKAKMWCWIAFGCGMVGAIAYAAIYGVAIFAAVMEEANKAR
jgi:hypothetical protein